MRCAFIRNSECIELVYMTYAAKDFATSLMDAASAERNFSRKSVL